MKITKSFLRQLVQEELSHVLESELDDDRDDGLAAALKRHRNRRAASAEDKTQHIKGGVSKTKPGGFDYTPKEDMMEDDDDKGKCPSCGCVHKDGSKWEIESNKTGKDWPAKYKSKKSAKAGLRAYHANKE